jgi:hypothetical protein
LEAAYGVLKLADIAAVRVDGLTKSIARLRKGKRAPRPRRVTKRKPARRTAKARAKR